MAEYRAMHGRSASEQSSASSIMLLPYRSEQTSFRAIKAEDSDDEPQVPSKSRPFIKPSILEIWFRSLRLSMLWNTFRRASHQRGTEQPKQAVNRGLTLAILSIIAAHLVPVSAAIALVSLNIHGYYIGGELAGPSGYDDVKLSGLQFSAKLHEIAIQASLSIIVVGLIRHELVAGEGIPFGAIFGSLQFADLSYLFSKEFMGTLRAKFDKRIVKVRLISLLIIGAFLALTVGPSSAIAMRPRIDNWPAGGTDFYLNATIDEIWPHSLDASNIPSSCNNITLGTDCISGGWGSVLDQLLDYWPRLTDRATMPESLQMTSPKSMRLMYTRETSGLYSFFETVATTQMSSLADSLAEVGRLWSIAANELSDISPSRPRKFIYRKDAFYILHDVYQPMTAAICQAHRRKADLDNILLHDTVEFPIAANLCNRTRRVANYSITPELSRIIATSTSDSASPASLRFVDLPHGSFGNNTIGSFIMFPPSWPGGFNLLTCTVDARWTPVTMQSTREIMKVVSGEPEGWPDQGLCFPSLPSINVTIEWAQYLNPYIQDSNKTVFQTLVDGIGVHPSEWADDTGFVQGIMETILATLVTSGLSRTASSATIQGELNHCPNNDCDESCGLWCLDMMPNPTQEFGYGGKIYNLSGIPDVSKLSKFTVQVDVNGYAYNIRGATMILSCTVLICYCILASVHILFVLVKRTSSNAWDSVSEVTALAMQSRPTEVLKNTCAGISTTGVFSNLVTVIKTGDTEDHLELYFGDHGPRHRKHLVEDDFYG